MNIHTKNLNKCCLSKEIIYQLKIKTLALKNISAHTHSRQYFCCIISDH